MHKTTFPNDLWFDLEALVTTAQPDTIALIGDYPEDFLDSYLSQRELIGKSVGLERVSTAEAPKLESPSDLVIMVNVLEQFDKQGGTLILGRMRDVMSRQFCVCVPLAKAGNGGWSLSELLALGLRRVSQYQINDAPYGLFKFSLNDYKSTPDWLNADNWANPELWGKYWW